MAADDLIQAYLDTFRARVAHRPDRDDLLFEMTDHVHSSIARWCEQGMSVEDATRIALGRLGDPAVLGAQVCGVPAHGQGMSLFVSRRLAWLSALAAILWLGVLGVSIYGIDHPYFAWDDGAYYAVSAVLSAAFIATTFALVGVNVRGTGEVDDATRAIGLLGVVGSFMALSLAWMVPLWFGLFTLVVVWTIVRTRSAGVASRLTTFSACTVVVLFAGALAGIIVVGLATGPIQLHQGQWVMFAILAAAMVTWLADMTVRDVSLRSRAIPT